MPRPPASRAAALVVAATLTAAGLAGVTSAAPARAGGTTICVGLVVDAQALGAAVSTDCASVASGATGIDVLRAAGHTVGFRSDGLLCTIDGLPKGGCAAVDDSHYWAYFHRAAGASSWTYSTQGPSSYQPGNGATEGWVYDDGSASTPPDIAQATICRGHAAQSPSPRPTRHHPSRPRPRPSAGPVHHHAVASAAATRASANPAARGPAGAKRRGSSARAGHPRGTPAIATPATRPAATPPASESPGRITAAPAAQVRSGGGSGGVLGVVLGLAVVASLGGLAVWRSRRQGGQP